MIPNVDASCAGNAHGELNRRIANRHVAPDSGVGRAGAYNDPIRIPNRCVFLDEVVVTREDADAEVVVRSREAVSARLVPPERVIASEDSYPAALQAR